MRAIAAPALALFYRPAMSIAAPAPVPPSRHLARIFSVGRLVTMVCAALPIGVVIGLESQTPTRIWLVRVLITGLVALVAYGVAEQWPARLPRWLGRWVFQLLLLAAAMPLGGLAAYWITVGGNPQFGANPLRISGLAQLSLSGIFFGVWIALVALVRNREALAHEQALAFERERATLARQATDARLRLLQAQVQPHFLFNTLANVQALVDTGSPQASRVLGSLIAYLRAAVPRLDEHGSTVAREVDLVRAYLDLMQMRMPDRLQYSVSVEPDALPLACPPTTLLTLVENAVRHGIDPAEQGGRIDVVVQLWAGRCRLRVSDTGVGLRNSDAPADRPAGLGTGLTTLNERLRLAFDGQAQLRLSGRGERGELGTEAEVEFPATFPSTRAAA